MSEKKKMNIGKTLGIDLGTTNSVITLYDGDKQEYIPIPSLEGDPIVPSVFYMKENIVRVGNKAREEIKLNPHNVITSVKSKIDSPRHRYEIKDGIKNLADGMTQSKKLTPIEVSTYILKYIKVCAEEYIGEPIEDVVITVPAYFREVERKSTSLAASNAGLNLIEIINEPTSACLAYGYANSKDDEEKNILVYDLGGGTFDVTYLNMSPEVYEVLATDGMKVGGDDIDLAFLEYVKGKTNIGTATEKQAKFIVEEAKKKLSYEKEVELDFSEFKGDKLKVTQTTFERVISPIVNKTISRVLNLIEMHEKVDEVVLVGGSTRIPLIRRRLTEVLDLPKNYFDKYKVDPDLAVSIGACVRGRIILGDTDIHLIDRTPFDLGVEQDDGTLYPIIKRGSVIPTEGYSTFGTAHEDVNKVEIRVYQGNSMIATDNQYLGLIKIDLDPSLAKKVKFKVAFKLDISGVLTVEVLNLLSREKQEVKVTGVVE